MTSTSCDVVVVVVSGEGLTTQLLVVGSASAATPFLLLQF